MRIKSFKIVLILTCAAATSLGAEEAPKKPWSDTAEVSVVSTNGNSKASTQSAKNTYTHQWTKTGLELSGGGLGTQSQGVVTAEQYFASEKVSYKLTERNYTFQKTTWDKNRFAGIKSRIDSNVGLGRELIETPKNHLIAELGAGYVTEDRIGSRHVDFASGRAYSKYKRDLSPTAYASQDAEFLSNFEDPDGYRVNTESALVASISAHFSLKVSYLWKHVGSPPPGFGRNDTTTAVALIANY